METKKPIYPSELWHMKNKDLYKKIPEELKLHHKFDKEAMINIILKKKIDLEKYVVDNRKYY
jgi:hypothetical protein